MATDTITFKRELKNINLCPEAVRLHGTRGPWTKLNFTKGIAKEDLAQGEYDIVWHLSGTPGGTIPVAGRRNGPCRRRRKLR